MKYTIFKYFKALGIIIFWISLLSILSVCIYVFYHPETQLFGVRIVNPLYNFIEKLPVWVYIVLYFIVFSILSVIVFISLSLYFDIQKRRIIKIRERYFRFFTYALTSFLILETYNTEENKKSLFLKIKPFLKKRIQILALFESYIKIQETLTLNLSNDFKSLLNQLNLQGKLESLIYNKDFDNKILAMRVLSYLQIHSCDEQIFICARSKNFALRTEAYAALIRLMQKDEHLVNFIGEKHNLSILDINIIVNAVLKNQKMNIKYRALLSSQNHQKIVIGLILAKYRYRKNKKNLILILDHIGDSNELINKLAWDALLTLVPDNEAVDVVIDRFESEPDDIKLHILENSNHIKDTRFLNFLVSIIEKQPLLIKIEAMKIIFNNDFDLLSRFTSSDNEEIKMAYKETSCMFINN